ncbi:MAG: hypothetical protein AAF371_09825 [Pseudomonadota bacterium]
MIKRILIAAALLVAAPVIAPVAAADSARAGVQGIAASGAVSARVGRVARAPLTAGRLGASIRSGAPAYNNGPGLERPRQRPHRRHRKHGFHRRRGLYGFPYGIGIHDDDDPDVVVITPPPPEPDPVEEAEAQPMSPATPKRVRVGGGAETAFAVTLEAEGANAGSTAARLTQRRDTLVAALVLAGADFCVAGDGGIAIERGTATGFRGTLELDLRALDSEALLLAIAGLPPETIAAIREGEGVAARDETSGTRRRVAPTPGQRCV